MDDPTRIQMEREAILRMLLYIKRELFKSSLSKEACDISKIISSIEEKSGVNIANMDAHY